MLDRLESVIHSVQESRWRRLSGSVVGPSLRIRHSTGRRGRRRGLGGLRGLHVSAAAASVPRDRRGVVHAGRAAGIGRDVGPGGDGDWRSGGEPASSSSRRSAAGSGLS